MAAPRQTFEKTDRLRRRHEFLTAQDRGRRRHTPHFVILLHDRRDGGPPRLGLTTSRKVGIAVQRNHARRLLREVFRAHRDVFPRGHDVVIIVREGTVGLTLCAVRDELLAALQPQGPRPLRPAPPAGGSRT